MLAMIARIGWSWWQAQDDLDLARRLSALGEDVAHKRPVVAACLLYAGMRLSSRREDEESPSYWEYP